MSDLILVLAVLGIPIGPVLSHLIYVFIAQLLLIGLMSCFHSYFQNLQIIIRDIEMSTEHNHQNTK